MRLPLKVRVKRDLSDIATHGLEVDIPRPHGWYAVGQLVFIVVQIIDCLLLVINLAFRQN